MSDNTDMVETIYTFMCQIDDARHRKDPLTIHDRDRWAITLIFSLLSDPHHRVGKPIMRQLIRCWLDRGGTLPIRGQLAHYLMEDDPFQHAICYLRDYGMTVREIANALCVPEITIYKRLERERYTDLEQPDIDKNESR